MFLFASATEPSLWEELWASIKARWFVVDMGNYENLGINGRQGLVTMRGVILGLFVGLIIAAAFSVFDKKRLGGLVRKIIREQAFTPETAQTMAELGYDRSPAVKNSVNRGVLSRVVICVEREAYEKECAAAREQYVAEHGSDDGYTAPPPFRINWTAHHFYIPDEKHYSADVRFDDKGSGLRAFVLVLIVAVLGAAFACFFLPEMLQLLDNMIEILKGKDKIL